MKHLIHFKAGFSVEQECASPDVIRLAEENQHQYGEVSHIELNGKKIWPMERRAVLDFCDDTLSDDIARMEDFENDDWWVVSPIRDDLKRYTYNYVSDIGVLCTVSVVSLDEMYAREAAMVEVFKKVPGYSVAHEYSNLELVQEQPVLQ